MRWKQPAIIATHCDVVLMNAASRPSTIWLPGTVWLRTPKRASSSGAGGPVSPELLARLGVLNHTVPGSQIVDGREAAFINTTSQCVAMIAGCFQRMENESEPAGPVLETYLRGLKT